MRAYINKEWNKTDVYKIVSIKLSGGEAEYYNRNLGNLGNEETFTDTNKN